mmetsp:Transcript_2789/g.3708  ORF Transcript_2789/g.3708 Transcript_2789/m.3708 type:complete len:220 (+) Transcript_2789:122-781(+)
MEQPNRPPPRNWKKLSENNLLEQKQFKSMGLSNFHHACLCTLQFQDFVKDYSKLRQKVETHPHLKQKDFDSFSAFALETVASKLPQDRPSNFHNTFIFLNGDCMLQLKNKEKLHVLKQQNLALLEERIRIVSAYPDSETKETTLSRLKARLEVPDKEQFWTPEVKKDIVNTNLAFIIPEAVPELKLALFYGGLAMFGLGVLKLVAVWKRRSLKKKFDLK